MKKALRTLQVELPWLLESKFALMRGLRRALRLPFERDFAAIPLLEPPAGAVFLDVGANRGQSLEAVLLYAPEAQVHAFEPNRALAEALARRWAGRGQVRVHAVGLGARQGERTLYLPWYKGWMFDGLASFDPEQARQWLAGRLYFYSARHLRLQSLRCPVRRLDELALAPFFIKVDVQGGEAGVLEGGVETLRASRPVLLVEAPDPALCAWLAGLDYEPWAFESGGLRRGRTGRLNTFFLTPERSARLAP